MNIFILNSNPNKCAGQYTNKHVVKMVLETAQLLCSVFPSGDAPYKRTHYNHPCSKWVRASKSNYLWLCELGLSIAKEYTKRYGKIHKSQAVIEWAIDNIPQLPDLGLTQWPICMPDEFIVPNQPILSYNNYYDYKRSIMQ